VNAMFLLSSRVIANAKLIFLPLLRR
jgi:hypothetical protein